MRSSSIKSTLVVFSLFVTLTAAAPIAHAKPSQTRRETPIYRTLERMLKRFLGPIAQMALPTQPIPKYFEDTPTGTQPAGAAPQTTLPE